MDGFDRLQYVAGEGLKTVYTESEKRRSIVISGFLTDRAARITQLGHTLSLVYVSSGLRGFCEVSRGCM